MSSALSTCVLLISLKQSVNGAQFLNVILLPLFPHPAANSVTVTHKYTCITIIT